VIVLAGEAAIFWYRSALGPELSGRTIERRARSPDQLVARSRSDGRSDAGGSERPRFRCSASSIES
jgi:hypothetical protein